MLKRSGLLENQPNSGLVVYADDQFVHRKMMQMSFKDIGIQDKIVLFSNGKEVSDYFDSILGDIEFCRSTFQIQPVALLLLDINMPV